MLRPVSKFICSAGYKNETSFGISALNFKVQNICHIHLFSLLVHKKNQVILKLCLN